MFHTRKLEASNALPRFTVALARHGDDVIEAQRLRWRVFAGEQGARLTTPVAGLDIDRFDGACQHLIVRDRVDNAVVGTYRLLTGSAARATGGFYSEQEFEIAALSSRDTVLEIGRSCVHPDYRDGAVIALLWSGLAAFVADTALTTLIGCASMPLADGGHRAAAVYAAVRRDHLAPPHLRATPRRPLDLDGRDASADPAPPPLIKGYLRSGAQVCGAPAYDPDFNTADFLMRLDLTQMTERYRRRYRRPPLPAVA